MCGQNVGISDDASFNPSFMFHLKPSALYSNDLFSVQNNSGTPFFHVKLNGNVGIGTLNPTEKLDLIGNFKFSGALMPNNLSGNSGQVLKSNGPGTAPNWTPFSFENTTATTIIAKYYASLNITSTWNNGSVRIFTIVDSDCREESTINVSISGPWSPLYFGLTIRNIVTETGQFRITIVNNTGSGIASGGAIPISWVAFY